MSNNYKVVRDVIRNRRTFKVLRDRENPARFSDTVNQACDQNVCQAIAESDWAPFHYDRRMDNVAQPWRFYFLDADVCRTIATRFLDWFDEVKPSNKLPAMLSACGSLVLVNWIPEVKSGEAEAKLAKINEEHLAATSAAVQNLLLLLTAQGMGTYWSSGGQFRTQEMFERLNISPQERMLAAVFVDYSTVESKPVNRENGLLMQRIPGKHRENRAPLDRWFRRVTLD